MQTESKKLFDFLESFLSYLFFILFFLNFCVY